MKNSFWLRSIVGVLSAATVMHKLNVQEQSPKTKYRLICRNVPVVVAIANSRRYFKPCVSSVSLVKRVNENWVLVKIDGKEFFVRAKDLSEVSSNANRT